MRILIIGGAGYIGSHTVQEALKRGHSVHVVDNLCNSSLNNLSIIAKTYGNKLTFEEVSADKFSQAKEYDGVIYLAALKSVTQGQRIPTTYFINNVIKMLPAFNYAKSRDIPFVFSSSASVYGNNPKSKPFSIEDKVSVENVYGLTKLACEEIIKGYDKAVRLRYFNVAGAGEEIGEEYGRMGNFVPRIYQQEDLKIRKTKKVYPERDYVHVLDVANINIDSVEGKIKGLHNVASGVGTSTKKLVEMAGRKSYEEELLKPEEPIKLIGSSDLELEYSIDDIIESSTKWYGKELLK